MSGKSILLILDNIRSRENVGSILRTADGAGVIKVHLCGITPTPPHEKISKTALGAEDSVAWEYQKETWRLLNNLKSENPKLKIVALEQAKDAINIFSVPPGRGFAKGGGIVLVVGNEVKGLSPNILKYCDEKVFIPMYGKKESLNVSVAAGIALYQLVNLK